DHCHELCHTLGAVDVYGRGGFDRDLSLMGPTTVPDTTFHLDPWHKFQLGWVQPYIHAIGEPGYSTLLPNQQQGRIHPPTDKPVLLFDPSRVSNEYFLLEFRTTAPSVGAGYDANAAVGSATDPKAGMAIWYVRQKSDKSIDQAPSYPLRIEKGLNG